MNAPTPPPAHGPAPPADFEEASLSAPAEGLFGATTRREASKLLTLMFSTGLVSIAALLFNILLTRILTVAEFGHIGVIRTGLEMLAVPAAFGMNACIARFAADARATRGERSNMLVTAFVMTGLTSLATILIASAVLAWPAVLPDPVALSKLRWMILVLPFVAFFGTATGFMQGTGRVRGLALAQGGRGLMRIGIGGALVWTWGFAGWVATYFIVEILAFTATLPSLASHLRGRWNREYVRPFASFSGYATLTLALSTLLTGVDVICLVHFRTSPEVIAHYKIATYVFTTALLLPNTFIQARWSRMVAHAYDPQHMWKVLNRNTVYLMSLVLPAAVLGYFLAPVLPMIFGEGYEPSVEIFRWLLPAFVIHSAGKLSSNLVVGSGLMRAQLATAVVTLTVNAALNIALIPSMGVAGAVLATTGSLALKTSLSPWILNRYRRSS